MQYCDISMPTSRNAQERHGSGIAMVLGVSCEDDGAAEGLWNRDGILVLGGYTKATLTSETSNQV
jgi:hypothetical protein